jgi:signal transduction histidine kinase
VVPVLDEAGGELAAAIEALRELAGGLYPVLLADAGLGPALAALAERAPVPTTLAAAPAQRLPEPAEQAGYFVVAEVLERAARLGGVREVTVEATVTDDRLHLVVAHDGADSAPMHGPADRVGALGGELDAHCGPGGTTVVAAVPIGKSRRGWTPARRPRTWPPSTPRSSRPRSAGST